MTTFIPKGTIILLGLYDGTAIDLQVSKEKYPALSANIKENGRDQIKALLPEFGSEEKVADFLQSQIEHLHNKILAVATHVTDENLELAWGEDWKMKKIVWIHNISSLLYLKRIKNNDMYGWSLLDYNSFQHKTEDGVVAMIYGKDVKPLLKKAQKIREQNKKVEDSDDGFEDCESCGYTHHYEDKCPVGVRCKMYEKWREEEEK